MSVFLGRFSPDQYHTGRRGSGASVVDTNVATFVDVQRNLLRAKPGDLLSFYHINSMAKQGSAVVAGNPVLSHNSDAIAQMR